MKNTTKYEDYLRILNSQIHRKKQSQWNTLMIRDCRNVTTVEEMFQQICQHVKGQFLSESVSFCCYFDLKYHVEFDVFM